jgi:hypothetical protein
VVPLTIVIDGVEHAEGEDIDADAFYACFDDGATPQVSTSQPGPGRFTEAYARLASSGADEILSIHIGSALSGTLNSARIAADASAVPERRRAHRPRHRWRLLLPAPVNGQRASERASTTWLRSQPRYSYTA